MDRRTQAMRAKRAAAQKRREKAHRDRELLDMDLAWGTVRFVAGGGYTVEALFGTKEEAEETARAETRKAMDASSYTGAAYTVVFAVPVHNRWEKIPGQPEDFRCDYARGAAYHATLRAARGGFAHLRALALWPSREEAEAAAAATAELGDGDVYTYVGGPIELAPLKKSDLPESASKPAAKPSTRAERRAAKKAAKKAAKNHQQAPRGKKDGE